MSPDQGGHTSFPVFGMKPKSYQPFTAFQTRDIVLLASESTEDLCDEAPHWSFVVDVTLDHHLHHRRLRRRRRRAERRQQRGFARLRGLQMRVLDVPVAADVLGDRRELDRASRGCAA